MMNPKKICYIKKEQELSDNMIEKKDVINMLSLDSLANIFMLLPIAERIAMEKVCSKWKEASLLAWHDIKRYQCSISIRRAYHNRMLTHSDVEEILLRCGKYLKELILSNVCNSSIMLVVGNYCKNLTKLEFEFNHKFNNYYINQFVYAFTQLDKLVFIKIIIIAIGFPIEVLNSLSEEINEIQLFFRHQEKKPILFDLKKFKKLHNLTLNGCTLDTIIQDISETITLVHLDLYNCSLKKSLWLFNQLENLEHLAVSCNYYDDDDLSLRITSQVLSSILNACKNLKHLEFTRLSSNREKLVFKNWVNLKNLDYLFAPWIITNESIIKILEHCQNLKYLALDLSEIPEFSVIKLTELKNLEGLKLYYALNVCSDETIIAIANNCKKLKHLEIPSSYFRSSFNNNQLPLSSILDELSKLQYLEYLNLESVYQLGDSTVIAIANNCKNLKNLNFQKCNDISETAFMALLRLQNLQILNVSYNPNVTERFISKLKRLKSLKCYGCGKITDVGVIKFIENCPDLEDLNIGINSNISIDTIIAADKITKYRINDILLNLHICNSKLIKTSKSVIESLYLVLHEF